MFIVFLILCDVVIKLIVVSLTLLCGFMASSTNYDVDVIKIILVEKLLF